MRLSHRLAEALIRRHRSIRWLLPKGYHAYPFPGGRIYLDLRESPTMLARVLRSYERQKQRTLLRYLPMGGTFVDIGGNKGDFALIAARALAGTGHVVCVEPFPGNADWIRRSIERNGYRNIDVVEAALAAQDGAAKLHVGVQSGFHSLDPAAESRSIGAIEVPTRTLDGVLEELRIDRVDVVKIDVEGGEEGVLAGAQRTLSGSRPLVLLLDLHPPRVDPERVCGHLTELGFTLHRPSMQPLDLNPRTREVVAVRAG
jgi:FkbM family methyltransferase